MSISEPARPFQVRTAAIIMGAAGSWAGSASAGLILHGMGTMDINEHRVRDVLIIGMTGTLDTLAARDAELRVLDMIEDEDRQVIINLGKLTYISSAGLRVIVQAAKSLNARSGELKICNARDEVKNVLRISGFHNLIKIYDTESEAFVAFLGSRAE